MAVEARERFAGKAVLITGASEGIGFACAQRLVSDGAAVLINGRRPELLEQAAEQLRAQGGHVATLVADLTDPQSAQQLVAATTKAFGRIDAVVANLGMSSYQGPPQLTPHDDYVRISTVSPWLTLALVKASLAAGMERGGAFVSLSALSVRKPFPSATAYTAGKAAVEVVTRDLAIELAPRGIRANAVAPGMTLTPATRGFLADEAVAAAQCAVIPLGRLGESADIAAAVAFLLSDDASYITGVVLDVDGGAGLGSAGFSVEPS